MASPDTNPVSQWFSRSQGPQNPTYALFPYSASADICALESDPDDRSNTFAQQSMRHTSSLGSICCVSDPNVDSNTSVPAVMRWAAFVGSITNGLANWYEFVLAFAASIGPMSRQFWPPSVVTRMFAYVYSE